tara:strand:+ start:2359 stop:2802 length:444 start_codon:yes stop_codon:yes gene_type:complete
MKKTQGYNSRLDESIGARDGKKSQSMKDRRDESKGMEKASGKRAYSADKSMDMMMGGGKMKEMYMGGGKMKQMYESGGMIKAMLKDPKQRKIARKAMQGYNDRLDESMGMRDGKASGKKQSMKSRRDESSAMEPRKYGAVSTMKYRK